MPPFFNKIGVKRDDATNGIFMPTDNATAASMGRSVLHQGGHGDYSSGVNDRVTDIRARFEIGDISKSQAKPEIRNLQKKMKKNIMNNNVRTKTTAYGPNVMA